MPTTTITTVETITYTQAELLAALGLPAAATITSATYDYQGGILTIIAQEITSGPTTT
jgi:hypothetical protein